MLTSHGKQTTGKQTNTCDKTNKNLTAKTIKRRTPLVTRSRGGFPANDESAGGEFPLETADDVRLHLHSHTGLCGPSGSQKVRGRFRPQQRRWKRKTATVILVCVDLLAVRKSLDCFVPRDAGRKRKTATVTLVCVDPLAVRKSSVGSRERKQQFELSMCLVLYFTLDVQDVFWNNWNGMNVFVGMRVKL